MNYLSIRQLKVADGEITYWAVIYGLPPTPELVSKNFDYVAVSGRRFLNKEEMEAKYQQSVNEKGVDQKEVEVYKKQIAYGPSLCL